MSIKDVKPTQRVNDSLTSNHLNQAAEVLHKTLTSAHLQHKAENLGANPNKGGTGNTTGGGAGQSQGSGDKK